MQLLKTVPKSRKIITAVYSIIGAFILACVLGYICLIQLTFVTEVSGSSMLPTIQTPISALMLRTHDISRGDIITIDLATPENPNAHGLFKRVLGLGGDDLLYMYDKDHGTDPEKSNVCHLYRKISGKNFYELVDEPYLYAPMKSIYLTMPYTPLLTNIDFSKDNSNDTELKDILRYIDYYSIHVDDGYVYFLGDNRNVSNDSRGDYGAMKINTVSGKLLLLYDENNFFNKLLFGLYF